jgi:hypothetical protein
MNGKISNFEIRISDFHAPSLGPGVGGGKFEIRNLKSEICNWAASPGRPV